MVSISNILSYISSLPVSLSGHLLWGKLAATV